MTPSGRAEARARPGRAAVVRSECVVGRAARDGVVATHGEAVLRVRERDAEEARTRARRDARRRHVPCATAVGGAKHARLGSAARCDPCIGCSLDCELRVARGERRFTRQHRWYPLRGDPPPGHATIDRREDLEAPVHRIAEGEAVLRIPEGDPVQKDPFRGITPYERPMPSAVDGAIDARLSLLGGACARDDRHVRVERPYAAEIEARRTRHGVGRPRDAAVDGSENAARTCSRPRRRAH